MEKTAQQFIQENQERRTKEIKRQLEIEKDKVLPQFYVGVLEDSYQFAREGFDNLLDAIKYGADQMDGQRRHRASSGHLWVSISKFVPVSERGNVIYSHDIIAQYNEKELKKFRQNNTQL